MGFQVVMLLGLMNLVLAVIVDSAAEARQDDQQMRAQLKEQEYHAHKKKLLKLCGEMDQDKSGELSEAELMQGVRSSRAFAATLELMDIGHEDLKCLFHLMDTDKSGSVTYVEFVDQLYKMKSKDTRTMLMFIKYHMVELLDDVEENLSVLKTDVLGKMSSIHDRISENQGHTVLPASPTTIVPFAEQASSGVEEPRDAQVSPDDIGLNLEATSSLQVLAQQVSHAVIRHVTLATREEQRSLLTALDAGHAELLGTLRELLSKLGNTASLSSVGVVLPPRGVVAATDGVSPKSSPASSPQASRLRQGCHPNAYDRGPRPAVESVPDKCAGMADTTCKDDLTRGIAEGLAEAMPGLRAMLQASVRDLLAEEKKRTTCSTLVADEAASKVGNQVRI